MMSTATAGVPGGGNKTAADDDESEDEDDAEFFRQHGMSMAEFLGNKTAPSATMSSPPPTATPATSSTRSVTPPSATDVADFLKHAQQNQVNFSAQQQNQGGE